MFKSIANFFYFILRLFDAICIKLANRSILIWLKEFIENDSYKIIKILDKNVTFFTPNYITKWLIEEFYTKEPETLEWIDNFSYSGTEDKKIFWDIGANIGLYSIYACIKHDNIEVVSFEPSTSNTRILSRNIFINNLENKIKIFQLPLGNIANKFLMFNESEFMEGLGSHTFGKNTNQEEKIFEPKNKYKIIGSTINFLLDNNILECPDYIKIDVDGIEHLILDGASNHLRNKKIKGIIVELNEDFKDQLYSILNTMKENNFKFVSKHRSILVDKFLGDKLKGLYNYKFDRSI